MRFSLPTIVCAALALTLCSGSSLPAWGGLGHTLISDAAIDDLPAEMFDDGSGNAFNDWREFLSDHAGLPDALKGEDDIEEHRHWIDLDQDAVYAHPFETFPRDLDAYLQVFDRDNGVCAWEGVRDHQRALVQALRMRNWTAVYRCAADLGHYIADSASPFHSTANYNGQLTGNNGIHSRHESTLVQRHIGFEDLTTRRSAEPLLEDMRPVDDPVEFGLQTLIQGYSCVDPILAADTDARSFDPFYGTAYYSLMFDAVGELTIDQLSDGGQCLADLWHTAWVEAGSPSFDPEPLPHDAPVMTVTVDGDLSDFPGDGEEQTNTTDLGDNICELDQLLMGRTGEDLCLGVAGNLAPQHAITLLLDTTSSGGSDTLIIPAAVAHLQRLNGASVAPGFTPDHLLTVRRTASGLSVTHVNLATSAVTELGSGDSLHLSLTGGGEVALDDTNSAGVSGRDGQSVDAAGDVRTGLEIRIPLAEMGVIGSDEPSIAALALLTATAPSSAISSQTLPGMPFGEFEIGHSFAQTELADLGRAVFTLESAHGQGINLR